MQTIRKGTIGAHLRLPQACEADTEFDAAIIGALLVLLNNSRMHILRPQGLKWTCLREYTTKH